MNLENLRTVRNYSLMRGMTTANIYLLIKKKELECVEIDGVKFIVLSEEEINTTRKL